MTKMEANMKETMKNIKKYTEEDAEKSKAELKQELQAGMETLKRNIEQGTAELQADMANLKRDLEGRFEAVNEDVGGLKTALVERFDEMKDVLVKFNPDRKKVFLREVRSKPSGDRENILVAGGDGRKSVEKFNWHQKEWLPLQPLPEKRYGATSFVYNDHVAIAGGYGAGFYKRVATMIQMNVEAIPDLSTPWSEYPVKLPAKLVHHSSVVYNDQLIVTGGSREYGTSDCIYEIQLSRPYTSKILFEMPEPRDHHCSEMFHDSLLILGGSTRGGDEDSLLNSVLQYDIEKNEYKHLAPLPYKVKEFATVKYGDNIIVIGGCDKHGEALRKVLMYNVVRGQSHMLPPMKCKRRVSAAVVIGNNIVVLGGRSERGALKSVEVFSFDSYTWSDLPAMSEGREYHTAVVV